MSESLERIRHAIDIEKLRIRGVVEELDKRKHNPNADNAVWHAEFVSCQEQHALCARLQRLVSEEMTSGT